MLFGMYRFRNNTKSHNASPGAFIYGAQFSKVRPGLLLGGCSGSNEVRIFEKHNDTHTYQGGISGFPKGT